MKKITHPTIITLLVFAMVPSSQVAIDMYLPSLPAMTAHLHASAASMQMTLSVYIFTMACAQMIYGPLSDHFGRRLPALIGLSIFCVSSFLCAISYSEWSLFVGRVFQGIGAGCVFVLSNAILSDTFSGSKLAKRINYEAMIWSLAPVLAPGIGGYIQQYLGWRFNFYIMGVYGFLLVLLYWRYLPETLVKSEQHANVTKLVGNYLDIIKSKKFIGFCLSVVFSYGAIVIFSIVAPFIFQNIYHINAAHYGLLVLIIGFCYIFSTYANTLLLSYFSPRVLLHCGVGFTLIGCLSLFAMSIFSWVGVLPIFLATCFIQLAQGFLFANSLSLAISIFPRSGGSASAMFGFIVATSIAILSASMTGLGIVNQWQLTAVYAVMGALTVFSYLFSFAKFVPKTTGKVIVD